MQEGVARREEGGRGAETAEERRQRVANASRRAGGSGRRNAEKQSNADAGSGRRGRSRRQRRKKIKVDGTSHKSASERRFAHTCIGLQRQQTDRCANWTQNGSNLNPTAWSGDAWMKMIYMHMAIVTLLDVHHE